MNCVELFAGAGGAAIGLQRAGFHHSALVEREAIACKTLQANGFGNVFQCDVRTFNPGSIEGPVLLVWASFPCQPFSMAGKRWNRGKAGRDERNGWPATVGAIDRLDRLGKLKPGRAWFVGENVLALTWHRKTCPARGGLGLFGPTDRTEDCARCYLDRQIIPDLRERFGCAGWFTLNSSGLGVPQHRRRVFIWAGPSTLCAPPLTHGPGLLPFQTSGQALGQRVIGGGRNPQTRDVAHKRSYRDLTKEPSVTITAVMVGNRGPFTEQSGKRKRLSPQQCAKLQGFPDNFKWPDCSKAALYRMVGNAVPPAVSKAIADRILSIDGATADPQSTPD